MTPQPPMLVTAAQSHSGLSYILANFSEQTPPFPYFLEFVDYHHRFPQLSYPYSLTERSPPVMEIPKIKQPREKLNARPLAVWILLGVTMEERANILDGIARIIIPKNQTISKANFDELKLSKTSTMSIGSAVKILALLGFQNISSQKPGRI